MTDKDSLKADLWWCHIFRSIVTSGDLQVLSGTAIKIYVALKVRANLHSGEADVGQDRIAKECGLSISSVKRGLAELRKMGYVVSEEQPGRACTYRLFERFPLSRMNGEVVATATFPYAGRKVTERQDEIKKMLEKGGLANSSPTIKLDIKITNQLVFTGNNITINGNVINGLSPSAELPARIGKTLEKHLIRSGNIKKEDVVFHSQHADDLAYE
ncbi:helix-turn-helix domain-containing protein [Pseudomonas sp.]|uniref:helix-turn-helix domain-containing protein n=1 Tax=Pseudomonas sp. TaxID=306 RepID=UPI0032633E8A